MSPTRLMPWVLTVVMLAFAAGLATAADLSGALLQLAQPRERRLSANDQTHPNHLFREQHAVFNLGSTQYRIAHGACVEPAHSERAEPVQGYLGMPGPSACNWYHSGFLFLYLNGRDLVTATPLSSLMVAENSADRAILDLVWRDPAADVRARLVGLPGRDFLICELSIDPLAELNSATLTLRCYPSFFTSYYKREGARRIQTPATLIEQGNSQTLPADEHWWAFYYDEVFDVARGEGEGPCALLLPPGQATAIKFVPGSYAVDTVIELPTDVRRIRLALWDFRGRSNADALAALRAQADNVRQELEQADFTPQALVSFDAVHALEEVNWALASAAAREVLGDTATEIEQWLARYRPALAAAGGGGAGVRTQEDLLRAVSAYNEFRWHIRLSKLLVEN